MSRKLLFLLLIISGMAKSQCGLEPTGDLKAAKNYLSFGQFTCALDEYLLAYQEKPDNLKINKAIAECYAGIPGTAPKSIKYLEFILNEGKYDEQDLWYLANAYHQNHDFDKAVAIANKYLKEFQPVDQVLKDLERLISNCNNGEQLKKFPIKVKFENLGDEINSEWDEINPVVNEDESEILFTTTRKGTMGGYPYLNGFVSDIYISKAKGTRFSKPRSVGATFNSIDIDELAGVSPDGSYLFLSTDAEGFQIFNLKVSYKGPKARSYPTPKSLDGINTNTTNEHSATINNEGNIIIFSSDRAGGYGGYDLYVSRILPNGAWGEPQNLGPTINTPLNEINPRFKPNERDIYFCSEGHLNMGGFDIFESTSSNDFQQWSEPTNLGYPINTPYDDFSIFYMYNNSIAYKSAYRPDSYGQADIYRLTFLDSTPRYTVVTVELHVNQSDSLKAEALKLKKDTISLVLDSLLEVKEYADTALYQSQVDSVKMLVNKLEVQISSYFPNCFADIEVNNSGSEQLYGKYKSNPIKGGVLMILEPGDYDISITADGYLPINTSLSIQDKNLFVPFSKEHHVMRRR